MSGEEVAGFRGGDQITNQRSQQTETIVPVEYGAEAFLELLMANGVEYVFINSGTDTYPIQEAMAKYQALGKSVPRTVLCPHETTAIAAAHGYFMVSRRPQVVLVHVDQGTLQLGGGLHNAQRGRAGIVICAGRAPMTFEGEMPGTRSISIHWNQEQLDQAGVVRNYTKWDYEVRRNENVQHVVQRAFQIAGSEPCGPVYLMLPRELLMERVEGVTLLPQERYGPVTTPQADLDALAKAARMLLQAQNPLIITGQSGRNRSAPAAIVELAELLGAPVVSEPVYMNFPSTHPLWAGLDPQPYFAEADVILAVDKDGPYIPVHGRPRPEARIIHIDIDPIKPTIPLWVFPTDLLLHADSAKAIPALSEAVRNFMSDADRARIQERHQRKRQDDIQLALGHADRHEITPEWLSYCINEVIDEDVIVLDECVTNSPSVAAYVQRSQPGTFYKAGGSSLGWGLGASLGAKLAEPDRTVLAVVGDGSFIYGCPTSTLWAAAACNAPFVAVIYNNELHYATKRSLKQGYPESYSAKTDTWKGMELSPSVDFAMLARACRAYGETVTQPAEVRPALERGLDHVRNGTTAVLDVRIKRP